MGIAVPGAPGDLLAFRLQGDVLVAVPGGAPAAPAAPPPPRPRSVHLEGEGQRPCLPRAVQKERLPVLESEEVQGESCLTAAPRAPVQHLTLW